MNTQYSRQILPQVALMLSRVVAVYVRSVFELHRSNKWVLVQAVTSYASFCIGRALLDTHLVHTYAFFHRPWQVVKFQRQVWCILRTLRQAPRPLTNMKTRTVRHHSIDKPHLLIIKPSRSGRAPRLGSLRSKAPRERCLDLHKRHGWPLFAGSSSNQYHVRLSS